MKEKTNKAGKIVLLIFLLICSGLGIAAFILFFKRCNKEGFKISGTEPLTDYTIKNAVNLWLKNQSAATTKYGEISIWNTSNVTDMSNLFSNVNNFNSDISNWNTSNVKNMSSMFAGATSFNSDISKWNTSNVKNMSSMFAGATSFNQPLNKWNTSNVTNMTAMFGGAISFNQPLDKWDTSNVKSMSFMFSGATSFNQPLNNWNTSNVISCESFAVNDAQWKKFKPTFKKCNPSPA